MDIQTNFSVTDLINVIIALVALFLGLRAELRSHAERKSEHLEKQAFAYPSLSKVLEMGKRLVIGKPKDINRDNLAADQSTLIALAECAKDAISPVISAFPKDVLDLEDIIHHAEQLTGTQSDLVRDDSVYNLSAGLYRDLYVNLLILSYDAFSSRHKLKEETINIRDLRNDPFISVFRERFNAFRDVIVVKRIPIGTVSNNES